MTKMQRGGILAGLVLGAGLFTARLAVSRKVSDILLALAPTAFEFSAVAFVGAKARALDAEIEDWRSKRDAIELAAARMKDAKEEFERRQRLIEDAETKIAAIEKEMQRGSKMSPEARVAAAVKEARAGYTEGVMANKAAGVVAKEAQ